MQTEIVPARGAGAVLPRIILCGGGLGVPAGGAHEFRSGLLYHISHPGAMFIFPFETQDF